MWKKARALLEQAGYTLDSDGYYLELEMLVFSSGSYADCGKVDAVQPQGSRHQHEADRAGKRRVERPRAQR